MQAISLAGRIQLIKAVIHPIVLFWTQSLRLPKKTINRINKLSSDFLWRGKKEKISWLTVYSPKEEGGMGLGSIEDINVVGSIKLAWRFISDESLFSVWTRNKYLT